jgi:hypothetical protein
MVSSLKQDLYNRIMVRLGATGVKVELTPAALEESVRTALARYRQRSEHSVEEGYMFIELQDGKQDYVLPKDVVEVRDIYRRGLGLTQGGTSFDPFSASFTNLYLSDAARQGGVSTYEYFTQWQETLGTLFGEHILFTFKTSSKELKLLRKIKAPETILLWVHYARSDEDLISEVYSQDWILRYSTAMAKQILGEIRGKFGTVIGPQGGTTLNGDKLKDEAKAEMELLESELTTYMDGQVPTTFLIG